MSKIRPQLNPRCLKNPNANRHQNLPMGRQVLSNLTHVCPVVISYEPALMKVGEAQSVKKLLPSPWICIITECTLPSKGEQQSASAPAGDPKRWMHHTPAIGLGFRGSAWGPFCGRPLSNGIMAVTYSEGRTFLIYIVNTIFQLVVLGGINERAPAPKLVL